MRFWAALIGLIVLFVVLSACGGGGGGGSKALITPPVGTDQNGGNNQLPPPFESVEVDVPLAAEEAGEVGGIVADYLGNPVPGLDVYLNSTDNLVSSTDEDGKFVMAGVPAGEHELMIGVEGTVVASYTLTYDDTTPMNLALSPSGLRTVSEFERFGALAGRVTNEEENLIPGVRVLIFNDDGFFLVKHTNENGVYEFPRVPVGEYRLLGFKRGYRTHVGQVAIHADELTTYDFVMHGFPVGRVIGVVGDEEGRALPRVHVFLLYREGNGDRPPPSFHTMTNEHGEYTFFEVPAGVADMLAFKPGYEPEDAEVTVPPQGQVVQNFVLHQIGPPPPPPPDYAFLAGYVFSGPDHPLAGALVELIRPEGIHFSAETDERGFYRFIEIPVGPYVFEVSAEGFHPVRGEIMLHPGQNHKNFYLQPVPPPDHGVIEGTVFWGESEETVPGAAVQLWIAGGDGQLHKIREVRTNEEGQYRFGEVPPGHGVVKAYKEDHRGAQEYSLEPGGHIVVDVRIFPAEEWGGKIVGRTRIVDPEHPDRFINIPGAEVKLFHGPPGGENPPLAVTVSGDGGVYHFLNLRPTGPDRPYYVVAHKLIEGIPHAGDAHTTLGENQVVELHITMHPENPPPGKVFGKVFLGESDHAVPGAVVKLFHGPPGPDNPPIRDTVTNEQGAYGFHELPPSGERPYFVVAEKVIEEQLHRGVREFHLAPGEEKRVDIRIFPVPPEPGAIYGFVLQGESEQKVPGAHILLFHGEPGEDNPPIRETWGAENGSYHFWELLPSGDLPYVIVAEKEIEGQLWRGGAATHLGPGQQKQVNLRIFPEPPANSAIFGHIVREGPDGGEIPVPGAVVKLWHGEPEGPPLRVTESNGQGYYVFDGLIPSGEVPYVVVAHKWIEEVLFRGDGETFLEANEEIRLDVWVWPED